MSSTLKQIISNTLSGWGSVFIRSIIALLMVPFLLKQLGTNGYGLIGLLGVLLSFSQVADLGLRQALGRELAEHFARKDEKGFNELANTALLLYCIIAILLAFICWTFSSLFVEFFKIPQEMRAVATLAIQIYGCVSILLSFITPVFMAGLTSNHRFDLVNSIQIVGSILSSLVLFVALSLTNQALFTWISIMLLYQLLILIFGYFLYKKYCSYSKFGIQFINFSRLKSLFHLGGYMYILQLTRALSERSDPLVISYFFGPSGVALYRPGGRISEMVRPVVLTMADQLYPLTTKQHIQGEKESVKKILLIGTRYTMLLGVLVSVGMFTFATPFCRLWLGKTLGNDYHIVAQIMMGWSIADLTTYATGTQWSILLGMKKMLFIVCTQLPTAILNILISIYLVGFTNLGIPGVLIATITIGIIRRPILMVYTAKQSGITAKKYFKESYLTPLIILFILCITLFTVVTIFNPTTITELFFLGIFTILFWFGLSFWIGLKKGERETIKKYAIEIYSKTTNKLTKKT